MIDWVQDHVWAGWLGAAVLLAAIEMVSLDLVLLMFAIGAVVAAVAAGLGAPAWLTILVFVVVSLALLFVARPPLLERLHAGPTLVQGHAAQVGRVAVVTEPVDERDGRVKLAGELWSARTDRGGRFDVDAEVQVLRVEGATVIVGPASGPADPGTSGTGPVVPGPLDPA